MAARERSYDGYAAGNTTATSLSSGMGSLSSFVPRESRSFQCVSVSMDSHPLCERALLLLTQVRIVEPEAGSRQYAISGNDQCEMC